MNAVIGLDTNILIRYLTQDDATQAGLVNDLIENLSKNDSMFINNIVVSELMWVLERGYKYERAQIVSVIRSILSTKEFLFEQLDILWLSLHTYEKSNIDFSDALIGEINKFYNCITTYTFDIGASKMHNFKLLNKK